MSLVTKGYGSNLLITQGYGSTGVVIVPPARKGGAGGRRKERERIWYDEQLRIREEEELVMIMCFLEVMDG